MRLSVLLLVAALLGILGGAAIVDLTAWPVIGGAVIADSICVGIYALIRDDGQPANPQVTGAPTLHDVLERQRQAS